jgi:hypothetical protein
MSTTTPTTRPRAGSPTATRTDPDRWSDDRAVTTANAPRTFEYRSRQRMPNATDETNEAVPR